ncbi:MAG: ADP-ribosylglycohydrolase family protein [Hyphomicrobiales bacterium]
MNALTKSNPPGRDELRDRYHGAILGLAVGNALGLPVESFSRAVILQHFPQGIREIDPSEARLPWDDDLAQAVILAEAILDHDTLLAPDLARRLVAWLESSGRGVGNLTWRVLDALRDGASPERAARLVWEQDGGQPAGNGAVMRCTPVAMRWPRDRSRLLDETRKSAIVTHHDPRCTWSAYAINLAVAEALAGRSTAVETIVSELEQAGADPHTLHAARGHAGHPLDALDLDGTAIGFTLKAMQAGLWCLEQTSGFEETLVAVIEAGGDTDTNGAVAGAVLGAKLGAVSIPDRWTSRVARVGELRSLADRLYERARESGEI